MTAQDVIDKARIILSDVDEDRYSDASLISLLNDSVRAFTLDTELSQDVYYIELAQDTTTYDVSDSLLTISRVQYEGSVLPLVSHDYMDTKNASWQLTDGEDVKAIVFDKSRRGVFRIYPMLLSADLEIDSNSNYGILIEFDISHIPNYINAVDLPFNGKYLSIYGVSKPATITAVGDTIDVDEQWKIALAHHVAGSALRIDQDTQNRTVGNEELMLYSQEILKIKRNTSENFTVGDLTTQYRGF